MGMYMNITEFKLGQVLAMECFLSQYGYKSEIKKNDSAVILKFDKNQKDNLINFEKNEYERDDVDIGRECEEVKIALPIREI